MALTNRGFIIILLTLFALSSMGLLQSLIGISDIQTFEGKEYFVNTVILDQENENLVLIQEGEEIEGDISNTEYVLTYSGTESDYIIPTSVKYKLACFGAETSFLFTDFVIEEPRTSGERIVKGTFTLKKDGEVVSTSSGEISSKNPRLDLGDVGFIRFEEFSFKQDVARPDANDIYIIRNSVTGDSYVIKKAEADAIIRDVLHLQAWEQVPTEQKYIDCDATYLWMLKKSLRISFDFTYRLTSKASQGVFRAFDYGATGFDFEDQTAIWHYDPSKVSLKANVWVDKDTIQKVQYVKSNAKPEITSYTLQEIGTSTLQIVRVKNLNPESEGTFIIDIGVGKAGASPYPTHGTLFFEEGFTGEKEFIFNSYKLAHDTETCFTVTVSGFEHSDSKTSCTQTTTAPEQGGDEVEEAPPKEASQDVEEAEPTEENNLLLWVGIGGLVLLSGYLLMRGRR